MDSKFRAFAVATEVPSKQSQMNKQWVSKVPYHKSSSIALFIHKQPNFGPLDLYQFKGYSLNFLIIRCRISYILT
jgi:hypothetical protein